MAESLRDIKQRIKSVAHTGEIARAMEAVSATKMRKAQQIALMSRPYASQALQLLLNLHRRAGSIGPAEEKTFFRARLLLSSSPYAQRIAVVVITSDKGLAGSYNSNVLRAAHRYLNERSEAMDVVAIGKKAKDFFESRDIPLFKSLSGFGDYTRPDEIISLADFLQREYFAERWKEVVVIYTNFRTTLKQEVAVRRLFPIESATIEEIVRGILPEEGKFSATELDLNEGMHARYSYEYLFDPGPREILDKLLPHLVLVALYHIVLECNASEHSARMVAMKNASDNADELAQMLTLRYNKARQGAITQELAEITSGASALEQ